MFHNDLLKEYPYFYKRDSMALDDTSVYSWCEEQFGLFSPEKSDYGSKWCTTFRGYYFKEERDYVLTILRWA